MDKIYSRIWQLAKPYYLKGRPMDIEHIEWMMHNALLVCQQENLDTSLLLPLVILHDVGYSQIPKDNPFKLNLRTAHMQSGAILAKEILTKLNYPKSLTEKIAYFVSVHDNWALGDSSIYQKEIILGVFNDLDYLWMATPKGFPALMKILNKTAEEMIEYLKHNEKPNLRPFAAPTTNQLYTKYLDDRRKENLSVLN